MKFLLPSPALLDLRHQRPGIPALGDRLDQPGQLFAQAIELTPKLCLRLVHTVPDDTLNGIVKCRQNHTWIQDELPGLPGDPLVLIWDMEQDDTVIRRGTIVLWREPCVYEGYFEVLASLKQRYGSRLHDFIPIPNATD